MAVTLRSVGKSFGKREVLTSVDCHFPSGQISTVLGVSGGGKTTLLRLIAGLEQPDRGDILFSNERVTDRLPQERNVGFVFQDLAHYPHLTVEKNIALPLSARGWAAGAARGRTREIADDFGLLELLQRQAGSLSGGEAQRLALARALVREPAVTLLDEPFSHLDAPLQREARRFVFSTLQARGATAILVTHNHQDAQEAGGKIFFLEAGRIVQQGEWIDLYQRPATLLVARVVSFMDPLELSGLVAGEDGLPVLDCPEIGIRVPLRGPLSGAVPAIGQAVHLVVRPEHLLARPRATHAVDAGASGRLQAAIVGTLMAGPVVFYRLRHVSGFLFAARADEPAADVGTEVIVNLAAAPSVLLPKAKAAGSLHGR